MLFCGTGTVYPTFRRRDLLGCGQLLQGGTTAPARQGARAVEQIHDGGEPGRANACRRRSGIAEVADADLARRTRPPNLDCSIQGATRRADEYRGNGQTVVTPLNRNRWNLNMKASVASQAQQRSAMRIFISEHKWKDRVPAEEEAIMIQGDDSVIPVPAVFMFVPGMPVVVNQNTHQGLKELKL